MKTKQMQIRKWLFARVAGAVTALAAPFYGEAAGTLTPVGSGARPIAMESHHVRVVINNGFARTEVEQTFLNPNAAALEAVYRTPVPEDGALSELTIWSGETVLRGEVLAKGEVERIYEEEKAQGNAVGKATQEGYQHFEFAVGSVPAGGRARMRYVYYEPLPVDTGVGRYTYRLEEGGTDEAAAAFWTMNAAVETEFSVEVLLKSAWPVDRTRTPGFAGAVEALDDGSLRYRYEAPGGTLSQDFVFYYLLEEGLPGRVEMMTYRESEDKPGTFMMVMTPGVDLRPLEGGADYVFALDVSGSMEGKLSTLVAGVKKAIGEMRPGDRFRVVAFNDRAWEMTRGWIEATPENVKAASRELDQLRASGGTNVYAGVELGLKRLEADRVSSLALVTDGVTNQGIVDPAAFYRLMHGQDARFFGFLLGNSSNWPLMELMADASGGAYRSVSNADDIIGEILLAKGKIAYESLHHAELEIDGVTAFDVSDFRIGKIHYGDQLILFGRYEEGGEARVRLRARVSGQDKVYETRIAFPDTDTRHPELERMWALDQVQKIQLASDAGLLPAEEAEAAIRDLGVGYQIVTEETAMIALEDSVFATRGMERRNAERLAREAAAVQARAAAVGATRVDGQQPMYTGSSPSVGGGGAVGPWALALAGLALAGGLARRGRRFGALPLAVLAGLTVWLGGPVAEATPEEKGDAVSIDRSISAFWNVSPERARVDAIDGVDAERPQWRSAPPEPWRQSDCRPALGHDRCRRETNTMTLDQSRRRGDAQGHFGIRLFKGLHLIDFEWGERSESETDQFSGTRPF